MLSSSSDPISEGAGVVAREEVGEGGSERGRG